MTDEERVERVMSLEEALRIIRKSDDPDEMTAHWSDHGAAESVVSASAGWSDEQWLDHDRKIADARAAEVVKLERDRVRAIHWALESKGFPVRALRAAEIADTTRSAIVRVRDWKPEDRSILVLSGSPGCGKTVAATWWAVQQRRAPSFVRATTFAASSRYDRDTRDAWFNASALVLDDLGTEFLDAKGSFLVDLDELLDVYYGNSKPLLITTNADVVAFKARYGERVSDRVRECGAWFAMRDISMRGAKS